MVALSDTAPQHEREKALRSSFQDESCPTHAPVLQAFRSGAVMGFLLAGNALLVLYLVVLLYRRLYGDDWEGLYEAITGYGLGGSSIALFGRVGGGIYTKVRSYWRCMGRQGQACGCFELYARAWGGIAAAADAVLTPPLIWAGC